MAESERKQTESETLAAWQAREGALPVSEVVHYVGQVAQLLQQTYGDEQIHGNIVAENITIHPDRRVTLSGWSGAKSSGQADIRADIFSLGGVFYEAVTGHSAFVGRPRWPTEIRPEVSDAISKVIAKMMAADPSERYQTPTEMLLDIGIVIQGQDPVIAANPPSSSAIALPGGKSRPGTAPSKAKLKPSSSSRQSAVGKAGPFRSSKLRRTSNTAVIATAGIGVLMLAVGAFLFFMRDDAAGPAMEIETGPPRSAAMPDPTTSRALRDEEEAKEALDRARAFLKENPEDRRGALGLLEDASRLSRGTRVESEARAELDGLRAAMKREAIDALKDLESVGKQMCDLDDYDGAAALLVDMPSDAAELVKDEREALTFRIDTAGRARIDEVLAAADELLDAKQFEKARTKLTELTNINCEAGMNDASARIRAVRDRAANTEQEAARETERGASVKLEQAISQFDSLLAQGEYPNAISVVSAAARDVSLKAVKDTLDALAAVGRALVERDVALRRGAATFIDKESRIATAKGVTKGTVESVDEEAIRLVVSIVDGGRVVGQSKINVKWPDLTAAQTEEFILLGEWDAEDGDKAISRAYLGFMIDDLAGVEEALSRAVEHLLHGRLTARLAAVRKSLAERAAEKAWAEIEEDASSDTLSQANAKRAARLLGEFSGQHGGTDFAQAKADVISRLKAKLELAQMVANLGTGLVGYWKLDEGRGVIARDSSLSGNDGKIVGGKWVKGRAGLAIDFNGEGDHIALGNPPELQVNGDMTISFWMKPTRLEVRQNPFGKCYGAEYMFTLEPSGGITFFHGIAGRNAEPYIGFGSAPSKADEWSHMTLVRDQANMQLYWYRNGVQTNSRSGQYDELPQSQNQVYIARGYVETFNGIIDDVRVYNRALSAQEVKLLYDSFPPTP